MNWELTLRVAMVAGMLLTPWMLYRVYWRLNRQGYFVSQRERTSGGVSGVFNELTRLAQPSIQHVEMVRDEAIRPERDDQGTA